jgi:hypothetical protein
MCRHLFTDAFAQHFFASVEWEYQSIFQGTTWEQRITNVLRVTWIFIIITDRMSVSAGT